MSQLLRSSADVNMRLLYGHRPRPAGPPCPPTPASAAKAAFVATEKTTEAIFSQPAQVTRS